MIPHLTELNIYENIFSNHLTGNITLVDGYNIPQKLPIIGEETIECKMRMTGAPDDDKLIMSPPLMQVHDLADRFIREGKHSQQFTLKLVSEKFMSNLPIIIGVVTLIISVSVVSSLIVLFKPKQDKKSEDCDK